MIRAKDVQVAHIYQARCSLDGYHWSGELWASYQEANKERQAHLEEHRQAEITASYPR